MSEFHRILWNSIDFHWVWQWSSRYIDGFFEKAPPRRRPVTRYSPGDTLALLYAYGTVRRRGPAWTGTGAQSDTVGKPRGKHRGGGDARRFITPPAQGNNAICPMQICPRCTPERAFRRFARGVSAVCPLLFCPRPLAVREPPASPGRGVSPRRILFLSSAGLYYTVNTVDFVFALVWIPGIGPIGCVSKGRE